MIVVENYDERTWKYLPPGFYSWEEVSGEAPGDVIPYPTERFAITRSDEVYVLRAGRRPRRIRKASFYKFLMFMTEDE